MRKNILLAWLLILSTLTSVAHAQTSVGRVIIRDILTDAEHFPEVTLNALVLDTEGNPLSGVSNKMFTLTEDETPVEFTMTEAAAGTRTLLVLDMGKWINNNTIRSRERVKDKERDFALKFVDKMQTGDLAGVLVVYSQEPILVQSFTDDKQRLRDVIQGLDWNNQQDSYGIEGLRKATVELAGSPKDLFKRMIFVSPGIMMWDVFGGEDSKIARDMVAGNIALYTVNISWQGKYHYYERFENIAIQANGQFLNLITDEDANSLLSTLDSRRNVYRFVYRSAPGDRTNRSVQLTYTGSGGLSDSTTYTIDSALLAPAEIQILVNNGEPVTLLPQSSTSSIPVHVTINGLGNRQIKQMSFKVNGQEYGDLTPTGENSFSSTWQISPQMVPVGTTEVFLEVVATDDLGISHQGNAAVSITLAPPSDALCRGLSSLPGIGEGLGQTCVQSGFTVSGLLNIILVIALIALVAVVWFKRDKVLEAGKDIQGRVTKAVDRLTNRLRKAEPKARLIALQGIDKGSRTEFDLYGETPIGSSTNYATLVFDKENISKLHCKIHEGHAGNWTIEDQESTNGTYVNGEKLKPFVEAEIETNAIIELCPVEYGGIKFRFEIIELFTPEEILFENLQDEELAAERPASTRVTQKFDIEEQTDPSDPSNQKW